MNIFTDNVLVLLQLAKKELLLNEDNNLNELTDIHIVEEKLMMISDYDSSIKNNGSVRTGINELYEFYEVLLQYSSDEAKKDSMLFASDIVVDVCILICTIFKQENLLEEYFPFLIRK